MQLRTGSHSFEFQLALQRDCVRDQCAANLVYLIGSLVLFIRKLAVLLRKLQLLIRGLVLDFGKVEAALRFFYKRLDPLFDECFLKAHLVTS